MPFGMLIDIIEGYLDTKFEVGLLCRVLRKGDVLFVSVESGVESGASRSARLSTHQTNTSNISATTGRFRTQIKPKNHLSKRYRTHRHSSNSMQPFLRSLL